MRAVARWIGGVLWGTRAGDVLRPRPADGWGRVRWEATAAWAAVRHVFDAYAWTLLIFWALAGTAALLTESEKRLVNIQIATAAIQPPSGPDYQGASQQMDEQYGSID